MTLDELAAIVQERANPSMPSGLQQLAIRGAIRAYIEERFGLLERVLELKLLPSGVLKNGTLAESVREALARARKE